MGNTTYKAVNDRYAARRGWFRAAYGVAVGVATLAGTGCQTG